MGNKVYIVTSGEYSDYGINSVFSTKELAQAYIGSFAKGGYMGFDIEEWGIDLNEQHLKRGRRAYFLRINKKGDIKNIEHRDGGFGFDREMGDGVVSYTHDKEWMNVECFADDENHAAKIAGEKRAQILAADLWAKEMT